MPACRNRDGTGNIGGRDFGAAGPARTISEQLQTAPRRGGRFGHIPCARLDTLEFPKLCPFTLCSDPDTIWEIEGQTKSSGISLPAVPVMVVKGRKCLFRIPVSQAFAHRQRQLALLSALLVFPFLLVLGINAATRWFDDIPPVLFLIPLAGMLVYACKKFLQRSVWIDYVGTDFVEIVIKRKSYAEEFCALNGLEFRRKLINLRTS